MTTITQDLVIFLTMVLLHSVQSRSIHYTNTKDFLLVTWNPEFDNVPIHPNIKDCEERGICRDVPNYPIQLAKSLLEQLKSKNVTRLVLETSYIDGGDADFENMCSEKEKVIYPQAARDQKGAWKFILNGHAFQGFVSEMCMKICLQKINFPNNQLICKQQYRYKKMLYIDTEHKNINYDYFEVPSCCSCGLLV